MLFNSYAFWAFLLGVVAVYRCLSHRSQNVWLLLASYVFYGLWNWAFLSLIWVSTAVDFWVSQRIVAPENPRRRLRWLWVSVGTNLGLLGTFKYFNFFITEAAALSELVGLPVSVPVLNVVLPVGISFYTFQTMSYTIDVYRGRIQPARDLLNFALYVCYFPQLVAGPIERFDRLMPQIESPRKVTQQDFHIGLYHVLIGLTKKLVIADSVAPIVNAIFATPTEELTGPMCWVGAHAFALQIYGDFSGYSSIAQGVSRWLGIDLIFNFRMPFLAMSPSDFWRRWHISLSAWLRDYLYIPLGGNRGSIYRNLMITMVLGGLWHGAAMTYVVWGFFQGVFLCSYRPFEKRLQTFSETGLLSRVLLILVFATLHCFGWILFRSESLQQAGEMSYLMLTDWSLGGSGPFFASCLALLFFSAAPTLMYECWVERQGKMLAILNAPWLMRTGLYCYFVLMLLLFPPLQPSIFIYFQF